MNAPIPLWPDGCRAAVSITMDNMGEAAAIQRNVWPANTPVGSHPSVTQVLPNLLELYSHLNVRLTYFIEAWNASVYPEAIQDVAGRGHEVAVHGWRHEAWHEIDLDDEAGLIASCVDAFEKLGLDVDGFRPPGGVLTETSSRALREAGITYCSPAGRNAALADDMVYLPFDWQAVDAYYYLPAFGELRELKGDSGDVLAPSDLADGVSRCIEDRIETGGYLAILFHPFLETEPERLAAMIEVIRGLKDDQRVWCAPCQDVAAWIRSHPDRFANEPDLDTTEWSRR